MAPTILNPPGIPTLEGFSTAVRVGLTVYISGQVSLDSAGAVVGPGDLRVQARQALANLVSVVRAAHGVPGDVVKLSFYVVGSGPEDVRMLGQVAGEFFPPTSPPAVTVVGVERLPLDSLLVSVDGIAVLRGEFPDRERDRR